ncbi:MAG TPA: hypothetical protein VJR05_04660 [Acidimicrobiia bacterium]|nr:hypothetical protein [Acidimicrobiia bacterium]
MTLVGPIKTVPRPRGVLVSRIGFVALAGGLLLSVLAWLLVNDLFRRLEQSLLVTSEAVTTVEATLEVADQALGTLTESLEAASAATDQAAASATTVSQAVEETSAILGTEVPAGIDSIRQAMPGLIEAGAVIDTTLSGLAFLGVPYNPEVPLDEAFRQLDAELAPLPQSLRDNAATIAELVPQAEGFRAEALVLSGQVEEMRANTEAARAVIENYRLTADRVEEMVVETSAGLGRSELLARVLVAALFVVSTLTTGSLIVVGRALTSLEASVTAEP